MVRIYLQIPTLRVFNYCRDVFIINLLNKGHRNKHPVTWATQPTPEAIKMYMQVRDIFR